MESSKQGGLKIAGFGDDDFAIIDRVLAGDPEPYSLLVDRYRDRIFRFIIRRVGHREEAEDILQNLFVEAWRSLPRFERRSTFSTWLHGIALNLCRAHDRAAAKRQFSEEYAELASTLRESSGPAPHELVEDREFRERFVQALSAVPEEFREAFLLVTVEGFQLAEAAELLGVPVGSIKSRVFRARGLLRQTLSPLLDSAKSREPKG